MILRLAEQEAEDAAVIRKVPVEFQYKTLLALALFLGLIPLLLLKVQLGELVPANDPVKIVPGMGGAEMTCRINRVADAPPAKLDIGNFKPPVPFDRGLQHLKPVFRPRLGLVRLERSLGRRHEEKPVQPKLLEGILRREEVAEVHGIKAPAEKSDFHKRAKLDGQRLIGKGHLAALAKRRRVPHHLRHGAEAARLSRDVTNVTVTRLGRNELFFDVLFLL